VGRRDWRCVDEGSSGEPSRASVSGTVVVEQEWGTVESCPRSPRHVVRAIPKSDHCRSICANWRTNSPDFLIKTRETLTDSLHCVTFCFGTTWMPSRGRPLFEKVVSLANFLRWQQNLKVSATVSTIFFWFTSFESQSDITEVRWVTWNTWAEDAQGFASPAHSPLRYSRSLATSLVSDALGNSKGWCLRI
jgi:hypothetical protein